MGRIEHQLRYEHFLAVLKEPSSWSWLSCILILICLQAASCLHAMRLLWSSNILAVVIVFCNGHWGMDTCFCNKGTACPTAQDDAHVALVTGFKKERKRSRPHITFHHRPVFLFYARCGSASSSVFLFSRTPIIDHRSYNHRSKIIDHGHGHP